ncbi:zinc finger A20 and AN1 domain-containing stress-associated protein 7-like [Phragmites australis]|uniref:zinc finger A20 and AN1 domain-containing stress-associated protein 7-like n=1 Tax=Phragmites australis TaxID=29695 RepID=UPI002D77C880|nr:zinc finger A20 and AN1 domain-containing stress-associated protein 7-like [Phragmites australis]
MSSFGQPQESAAPPLCVGFFGSPTTLDMCSVCYKKHGPDVSSEPGAVSVPKAVARSTVAVEAKLAVAAAAATVSSSTSQVAATKACPNRCAMCLKKIRLTGFTCRCRSTFSGSHGHRYTEEKGEKLPDNRCQLVDLIMFESMSMHMYLFLLFRTIKDVISVVIEV